MGVAGDEGLFGAEVGVLGRGGAGAGGEQGGDRVPAVGHLGGQLVVGQAGVAAQFLRDEFDQFGVVDRLPAARRRADLRFGGAASGAYPQQSAAGQPVHRPGAAVRQGFGHLAQQAVEQRHRRVGVGAFGHARTGGVGALGDAR